LLILDRQRLEEDRASHKAILDSAEAARGKMRELQTLLVEKDDEINLLKLRQKRAEIIRHDEDLQVAEVTQSHVCRWSL